MEKVINFVETNNKKPKVMTATDQLQQAKKSLNYVNDCLTQEMENWERKEYINVKKELLEEIEQLEIHINIFRNHFN